MDQCRILQMGLIKKSPLIIHTKRLLKFNREENQRVVICLA